MLAFGISILLFFFWMFLGLGVLAALRFTRLAVRNLLLAPVVGASATLLPLFWLSRIGLPVRVFAGWLTLALMAAGGVLIARYRPRIAFLSYLPFLLLFALAAGLTLRPMFWYGFNWVSYGNDDMANYVLAAERLYQHGYMDTPTVAEFLSDRDPSVFYWFNHVYLAQRTGSEMLLAWVHGVFGQTALELFMPLIAALYFAMLSATCGLVYRTAAHRRGALWTGLLVSCSALTSLGLLYQLIAQIWGLALLAACVTLILRPFDRMNRPRLFKNALLAALAVAALVISYPEMFPFLIVPAAIFTVVRAVTKKAWRSLALAYGLTVAFILLLINTFIRSAAAFFATQLFQGLGAKNFIIFPYFLLPSGLANFWGMLPINWRGVEPWMSIGIAVGGILLVVAAIASVRQAIHCRPWALVAGIMLLLSAQLFAAGSDFGLFKLAMFIQPFLLAVLATSWIRKPLLHIPLMLTLSGMGLFSQYAYVERSSGEFGRGGGGLVEVPGASASGLIGQLIAERQKQDPGFIVSDTSQTPLGKFEAAAMMGRPVIFPADDIFGGVLGVTPKAAIEYFQKFGISLLQPDRVAYAEALRDRRKETYIKTFFQNPAKSNEADMFYVPLKETRIPPGANVMLLTNGHSIGVLNRGLYRQRDAPTVTIRKLSDVHDHLVFVSSALGRPPAYDGDPTSTGMLHLEPDPTYNDSTVAGTGQYLLFEALNASPTGHLTLNLTNTYMPDGKNELPPARLMGAGIVPMHGLGRGSARIFSPSIAPQKVDGRSYLLLDMGAPGSVFPEPKRGLMRLFGMNVRSDSRRIVGFTRDISFLSEAAFTQLMPPDQVSKFPAGLANPALEYSGFYEDGWVAEDSYLRLHQPGPAMIRVSGMMPDFQSAGSSNRIRILVDGQPFIDQSLRPGSFAFEFEVPGAPGNRKIQLHFDSAKQLADDDPRPASAKLTFVGFNFNDIADPAVGQITSGGWYPTEVTRAGEVFRWANNDAAFMIRPQPSGKARLAFDVERGTAGWKGPVALRLLDQRGKVLSSAIIDGRSITTMTVPVPTSGPSRFRLHVETPGRTVQDGRILSFRVFHIGMPADIVAPGSGIEFGKGWYEMESFAGAQFRWARNVAELDLTPGGASTLAAEVEPNLRGQPVRMAVLDGKGNLILGQTIGKRTRLRIPLGADRSAVGRLVFQVDERTVAHPPNDPRELSFRVFRLRLE